MKKNKFKIPDVSDKVGRPIRLNNVVLKPKAGMDYAELVFVGDSHFGSPQFDKPRFLAMLDYCLENELYVILMGDLLETATRYSVGAGVYEQEGPADDQYETMCDWLKPLAEKGLIIGAHLGNHEERIYKESGFNVMKAMCRELKVKYLGDACWTHLKVGGETYVIYSLHGRTGGRFLGTCLLALERIALSFFADLVAMAHTHQLGQGAVLMQKVVNGLVKEFKKYLLLTGGYLKYDGGYGQKGGMQLPKLGSPKVKFHSDCHDLFISW